jgi:hypothetical protein
MKEFYIGLHQPSDAKHFETVFLSINRLRGAKGRKAPLPPSVKRVVIDSGAFTELFMHGHYRHEPAEYACDAARWADGRVVAIVAQDYMCEPIMLAKTGLTIADHQRLTIERYDALRVAWENERIAKGAPVRAWPPIIPVLQGWTPEDYTRHLTAYGNRIRPGMWVGVGSICKRQARPAVVATVLRAIKELRPDLLLHGFGVKLTSLKDADVRKLLETADSTAWSYAARKQGRNANDWREAKAFVLKVAVPPVDPSAVEGQG